MRISTGALAPIALLSLLFSLLPGVSRAAEPVRPLVLERTIPLPDVSGRIDHMAVQGFRTKNSVATVCLRGVT